MQLRFDAPSLLEASEVKGSARGVEISPIVIRGQHLLRVGFLTAIGDSGMESKAMVFFNGNTGEFVLRRVDGPPVKLAFDGVAEDFAAKRAAARAAGRKKNGRTTRAAASPAVPPAVVSPPVAGVQPPAGPVVAAKSN